MLLFDDSRVEVQEEEEKEHINISHLGLTWFCSYLDPHKLTDSVVLSDACKVLAHYSSHQQRKTVM